MLSLREVIPLRNSSKLVLHCRGVQGSVSRESEICSCIRELRIIVPFCWNVTVTQMARFHGDLPVCTRTFEKKLVKNERCFNGIRRRKIRKKLWSFFLVKIIMGS